MSSDPVQQVIDLLDGSVDGDWSNAGAKPALEKQEDSTQNFKGNREGDAIYFYTAADGAIDQMGFDWGSYEESARVSCDIWTVGDDTTDKETQAENLYDDLLALILEAVNDNEATTNWQRYHPVSSNDLRAESIDDGDHARKVLDVRPRALRDK